MLLFVVSPTRTRPPSRPPGRDSLSAEMSAAGVRGLRATYHRLLDKVELMLPEKLRPLYNHPAGKGPGMANRASSPRPALRLPLKETFGGPLTTPSLEASPTPQPNPLPAFHFASVHHSVVNLRDLCLTPSFRAPGLGPAPFLRPPGSAGLRDTLVLPAFSRAWEALEERSRRLQVQQAPAGPGVTGLPRPVVWLVSACPVCEIP